MFLGYSQESESLFRDGQQSHHQYHRLRIQKSEQILTLTRYLAAFKLPLFLSLPLFPSNPDLDIENPCFSQPAVKTQQPPSAQSRLLPERKAKDLSKEIHLVAHSAALLLLPPTSHLAAVEFWSLGDRRAIDDRCHGGEDEKESGLHGDVVEAVQHNFEGTEYQVRDGTGEKRLYCESCRALYKR
ncbi:hypothetical protein GJ744_002769 [Endocarpon pusillum]|uniref:Uncharacterized protein n=1 Tax=Endocarpon pusillum TaxID=364733 RepID=A0A8H7ARW3_9EURO|nr:hypothetical protein GJ744_002769 [Endocarpon pusillum]